ncbi:MAG: hypothetical protein LBO79_03060 [Zoogloeaceae bacterium]|jgi:hypothetical protein|nr:hypothetical protein [Zoogloeaceae bacterium]
MIAPGSKAETVIRQAPFRQTRRGKTENWQTQTRFRVFHAKTRLRLPFGHQCLVFLIAKYP